jgi:hypothetical protein
MKRGVPQTLQLPVRPRWQCLLSIRPDARDRDLAYRLRLNHRVGLRDSYLGSPCDPTDSSSLLAGTTTSI